MLKRPRRLRQNENIRKLVRETRISKDSFIYPIFFKEGTDIKEEIPSMEGQFRYSVDRAEEAIDDCLKHGVNKVLLFGIPDKKDETGSEAYSNEGIVQKALRKIKDVYKDEVYIITDVCMCEYTSHGHCGILDNERVDNDITLSYLSKIALSHAVSGADMVAPSDMMDGRVESIRNALDENGYKNIPIMSYAMKYASNFYKPFREAANSVPSFGDRQSYQMDPHNIREAIKEVELDTEEGADILMVKPMLSFLDVVNTISHYTELPVATYSVSGEYAMIKNAGKAGLIDEYGVMCETAVSAFRAGADILITYYAKELVEAVVRGDIG